MKLIIDETDPHFQKNAMLRIFAILGEEDEATNFIYRVHERMYNELRHDFPEMPSYDYYFALLQFVTILLVNHHQQEFTEEEKTALSEMLRQCLDASLVGGRGMVQ